MNDEERNKLGRLLVSNELLLQTLRVPEARHVDIVGVRIAHEYPNCIEFVLRSPSFAPVAQGCMIPRVELHVQEYHDGSGREPHIETQWVLPR